MCTCHTLQSGAGGCENLHFTFLITIIFTKISANKRQHARIHASFGSNNTSLVIFNKSCTVNPLKYFFKGARFPLFLMGAIVFSDLGSVDRPLFQEQSQSKVSHIRRQWRKLWGYGGGARALPISDVVGNFGFRRIFDNRLTCRNYF